MRCTLEALFDSIAQKRNNIEYYQDECVLKLEDYLQAVTCVLECGDKVIVSDCNEEPIKETIDEISQKTVEVSGLLLYYYVLHDDEFCFFRIKDNKELYAVMNSKLRNCFIGDLVVFENGAKKRYCVRDEEGRIMHYHVGEHVGNKNFVIEWC